MITGVANAVTAPTLAPGKVIDGPLDLPGAYADVTAGSTASDTAAPASDPADTGSGTPSDPASSPADPTDPTATADPSTAAPGTDPGTTAPSSTATATGTTGAPAASGGTGGTGGSGMVQAPARQTLAETGGDSSVPFLLAGGFTLLAGGLVFRFGPRTAAPRHGA